MEKGDTRGRNFGVAFDVETTTVVGTLIDLDTGEELATRALLNPQASFGEDVVSRIDFLKSLRYRIINFLNHPSKIILGKERRSFAICPKNDLSACVKKRPSFIDLLPRPSFR